MYAFVKPKVGRAKTFHPWTSRSEGGIPTIAILGIKRGETQSHDNFGPVWDSTHNAVTARRFFERQRLLQKDCDVVSGMLPGASTYPIPVDLRETLEDCAAVFDDGLEVLL